GRFAEVVGGLVARATAGGRPLRAFGEMVALLAAEGNHAAAIRLETLWNELQHQYEFSLYCAYPLGVLGGEGFAAVFDQVVEQHGQVIPAESYSALDDTAARQRAIARLQQQAASLRAEVAQRQRAEQAGLRLAAIVDSSDDAIIGKTLDGII